MREPLPHVARFVEMTGHALRAPADGKCKAAEIGHDGEYRFVGDIVADEDRAPALEGFVGHQFNDAVERPGSAPAGPEFGFISLKG